MTIELSWALALVPFLTAGAGAYVGSYLKTKGENLATHEDIGKLVDQVRAVTTTTKQIESKIAGDLWDRQKRWELRRDAIFDASKKMAAVKNALSNLHAVHMTDQQAGSQRSEVRATAYQAVINAANEYGLAALVGSMACSELLRHVLVQYGGVHTRVRAEHYARTTPSVSRWASELVNKLHSATEAMREALFRNNVEQSETVHLNPAPSKSRS